MALRALYKFAILLASVAFILVVGGGLVTSGAPPIFRIGHRHLGETVTVAYLVLCIAIFRAPGRSSAKRLSGALVILAAVEGAIGVLGWPVIHACVSQLFFSGSVALVLILSPSWQNEPTLVEDTGTPSLGFLSKLLPILTMGQIALGAALRHRLLGGFAHMTGAIVVIGITLTLSIFILSQHSKHPTLRDSSLALLFGAFMQIFLGLGAYVAREAYSGTGPQPWTTIALTVSHLSVGTLTMAAGSVVALQVARNVKKIKIVRVVSRGVAATS